MSTKSLPKLPERPKPPDTKESEESNASEVKQEQEYTQIQTAHGKRWLLSLGRPEYIVPLLCWAFYSIFAALAYRNGGT